MGKILGVESSDHSMYCLMSTLFLRLGISGNLIYELVQNHYHRTYQCNLCLVFHRYASVLFEETPEKTKESALRLRSSGYSV